MPHNCGVPLSVRSVLQGAQTTDSMQHFRQMSTAHVVHTEELPAIENPPSLTDAWGLQLYALVAMCGAVPSNRSVRVLCLACGAVRSVPPDRSRSLAQAGPLDAYIVDR